MVSFFLFRWEFQEEIEPSWINYLSWTAYLCGGEYNTPDTQNTHIFLSAIALMQVNFLTEDSFSFIPDCGNSFNCKLKRLINHQIIIFYSPSNALCSSDEFVQKNILSNILLLVCLLFSVVSTSNKESHCSKSLRSKYWEINQATPKCKLIFGQNAGVGGWGGG